jgi:hypothetical protein
MRRSIVSYVAIICLGLVAAFARPVVAQDGVAAVAQAEVASKGALLVDVQPGSDESAKRLAVNVHPGGAAQGVSGAADVVGFPIIRGGSWGDVDWKVDGSRITGTLKTKEGSIEGTFDGTISATGVSGKFTHVDGRVGLWSWDGPPPLNAKKQ